MSNLESINNHLKELEKGLVYEFVFEQHKAPLSKKVSEFLEKEKVEVKKEKVEVKKEKEKKVEVRKDKVKYYMVKSGDTLSKIAARHKLTVSKLCQLNGIKSSATLRVGKSLRVN